MARQIKIPAFLACEGSSEQGYGRWLNRLADNLSIPVVIQAISVGGGDPLELVEKSVYRLRALEKQRGPHRSRGLLLDRDCHGRDPERDRLALERAGAANIHLVWQEPCHEAFVIRHFEGYEGFHSKDEDEIWRTIRVLWPAYTKGMDAVNYGSQLTQNHLARARAVEPTLQEYLDQIGWR